MSSPCIVFNGADEPISELAPPSSPPQAPSTLGSRKPKRPPPITPNRFTRFFTPRNSKSSRTTGSSARQLRDITKSAINRGQQSRKHTTPRKTVNFADEALDVSQEQLATPAMSSRKRKKAYLSPETSPLQSSPSKRARDARYATPPALAVMEEEEEEAPPETAAEGSRPCPLPIRRLRSMGGPARILQRSFGGTLGIGRGFVRDSATSWQHHTADFYSGAEDYHQLPRGAPPFCTTSCHTNDLVAVGDEDGYITLLDADNESDFTKAHLAWRAHSNAIMDIQFSSDDAFIATASGDQTSQVIDARTQQTVNVLAKHKSSVKQVRFQPGDDKILATSSRDGSVQIWDLRCRGATGVHSAWGPDAPYASSIKSLGNVHADSRADVSVTALSFLPEGRQHILLTASDASTCIKLWDIRGRYSFRAAIPISTTAHPTSHTRHRHFAVNSLTFSGDANRLYALSKDNTVYAYSVPHLVLGHAPELSERTSAATKYCGMSKDALGPIYGFRHHNFHAGSFYVKAALRKAAADRPEMLAVGSTDGCPVLFPTDEKLLRRETQRQHPEDDDDDDLPSLQPGRSDGRCARPALANRSFASTGATSASLDDTIPIYEHGTPLIRGHDTEVTSLTWAVNGSLVSVGDDCKVRHWKEGPQARELRLSGEAEGKRWASGWAVVDEDYDEDDG